MSTAKTYLFHQREYSTPFGNLMFLSLYTQFTNAASTGQEMKCQKSKRSAKVCAQMENSKKKKN